MLVTSGRGMDAHLRACPSLQEGMNRVVGLGPADVPMCDSLSGPWDTEMEPGLASAPLMAARNRQSNNFQMDMAGAPPQGGVSGWVASR